VVTTTYVDSARTGSISGALVMFDIFFLPLASVSASLIAQRPLGWVGAVGLFGLGLLMRLPCANRGVVAAIAPLRNAVEAFGKSHTSEPTWVPSLSLPAIRLPHPRTRRGRISHQSDQESSSSVDCAPPLRPRIVSRKKVADIVHLTLNTLPEAATQWSCRTMAKRVRIIPQPL